jgi:hypothetical protein
VSGDLPAVAGLGATNFLVWPAFAGLGRVLHSRRSNGFRVKSGPKQKNTVKHHKTQSTISPGSAAPLISGQIAQIGCGPWLPPVDPKQKNTLKHGKTRLEHFHQICSVALKTLREAVFLVFGGVLAQLQAVLGMRLRQSLAKDQKSSLRSATSFLSML